MTYTKKTNATIGKKSNSSEGFWTIAGIITIVAILAIVANYNEDVIFTVTSPQTLDGALIGFSYEKPDLNDLGAINAFFDGIETKWKTASIDAHRRPTIKLSAKDIAGYSFLGWTFDGEESIDKIQNPSKTTGFSPVEYAFNSGETTAITAIYRDTEDGGLKFDHIKINWE